VNGDPEARRRAEQVNQRGRTMANVKFKCSCGKIFQTAAKNAGKKTKCSACGAVLIIRADAEDGAAE